MTGETNSTSFNPNNPKYRACCCHSKSFTVGFGIVEIFIICFLLVAVVPDFHTKTCLLGPPADNSSTTSNPVLAGSVQPPSGPTNQFTDEWQHNFPLEQRPPGIQPQSGGQQGLSTPDDLPPPATPAEKKEGSSEEEHPFSPSPSGPSQGQPPFPPPNQPLHNLSHPVVKKQQPGVTAVSQPLSSSSFTITTTPASTGTEAQLENFGLDSIQKISCFLNMLWLLWAIAQIISINVMFYGVKKQMWPLFLPHILLRLGCLLAILLLAVLLIIAMTQPLNESVSLGGLITLCCALLILAFWVIFLIKSEIRCSEFMKKSAETGFSISNTRPIGPPTISLSVDGIGRGHQQQLSFPPYAQEDGIIETIGNGPKNEGNTTQETSFNLPPLRHTYRPR